MTRPTWMIRRDLLKILSKTSKKKAWVEHPNLALAKQGCWVRYKK